MLTLHELNIDDHNRWATEKDSRPRMKPDGLIETHEEVYRRQRASTERLIEKCGHHTLERWREIVGRAGLKAPVP